MSQEIRSLEPKALWNKFADLNAVPRPSKKEDRVIAFIKKFGESLGLETFEDEIRNVIIRKPATAGMENRKAIVLQGHLDMVHQKNADTVFDFDTQGIDMYVDGDWVRARGTTLGADNGLGVAAIMAILESTDIPHPAIEALFTIDEETGMTGALNLKGGILQGQILLNMDTEEDDEIDIGCAGGIDVTATAEYDEEATPEGSVGYTITVKGLKGGHSGMDIHKGLGNANKIMNRLLFDGFDNFGLQISEIKGGSLRNAIPRESQAKVIIAEVYDEAFVFDMQQIVNEIKTELKTTEPNLEVVFEKMEAAPARVMPTIAQFYFVRSMYTAHNGVYSMSADFADLVETSNNIAKVIVGDGQLSVQCLTRSSVETAKFDLANALRSAFELMGCEVEFSGAYPGWTPNSESEILDVLVPIYEKQNGEKPKVVACHAGLECGILGTNYPDMDMISFGPTIHGAHSPDERASISSSQKFWKFVLEILATIPVK
ncbi:aminoacyl-histidine dipeptidase [Flavobacterium sp. RSP49]|uniref:aminoacyl-histidine dipeptidase n=1 Tax=unclassified Flavobacterium TaxID=196869 RepID=UPI000F82D846|nr:MULTISPECIES: aminoacyl-histidine dipeptidase [unclassified Flavobacterium]RTY65255.1 aminoacyl-histidine dipeptidase [Flavobacterium sp. LB2P53]RTY74126.1 aminoacyl-histidine dipeptidase [Flavobacterium sp. LS1R10]RTZ00393.1 aminoacyl-histidine dipeptidase [Flavobacterium sp. RSP49]